MCFTCLGYARSFPKGGELWLGWARLWCLPFARTPLSPTESIHPTVPMEHHSLMARLFLGLTQELSPHLSSKHHVQLLELVLGENEALLESLPAATRAIPVCCGGSLGALTWLLPHLPGGWFFGHRQKEEGRSMRRRRSFYQLKPVHTLAVLTT